MAQLPNGAPKVLVVDGDSATRNDVRSAVAQDGYQVVEADTGAEGLRQVDALRPSLVLLEVTLPDASGFDVCRELRKKDTAVPVIMMSSRSDELDPLLPPDIRPDAYSVN